MNRVQRFGVVAALLAGAALVGTAAWWPPAMYVLLGVGGLACVVILSLGLVEVIRWAWSGWPDDDAPMQREAQR